MSVVSWLIPPDEEAPAGPPAAIAPSDDPEFTQPIDHVEAALDRLPHQYRQRCDGEPGESNTQKLIRVLMSPAADLENTQLAVLNNLNIDNARGFLLDIIGKWVGRPRNGVADDEIYRRYVRAQVSANKSDGIINDILTVASLVIDDEDAVLTLRNEGTAAYTLQVGAIALTLEIARVLVQLLLKATSAGVRMVVEYSSDPPGDALYWDTQGVWDTGLWWSVTDKEI